MRWKVLRPSVWNLLDVSIVGLVLPDRQLQFFGHSDQLGQGTGAHLFHNLTTLDLYRDFAGAKFGSGLLVEQAGDDQPHYFPLAGRQRVEKLAQVCDFCPLFPLGAVAVERLFPLVHRLPSRPVVMRK